MSAVAAAERRRSGKPAVASQFAEKDAASEATRVMAALKASLSDRSPHPEGTPLSARLTMADVDVLRGVLPTLPTDVKQELASLLAHVPPAPPAISFRSFVATAKPDYRWYPYGDTIHEILMDVTAGTQKRLIIFAPPRHGKSELISRLYSAYYQYRFPHRWVGLTSYGDDLAFGLARASRENYLRAGGTLGGIRDVTSVKTISTGHSGGMWSAGVGGPITGKGFHLGIVDDPLKNSQEAQSVTIRNKHKEWWQSTFYTRTEPNAAIIIVMTPWHDDDLANWLLRRETAGEDTYPERWHIVALDAIRTPSEPFFVPPTCTLEPDPRPAGAALCPERYPLSELMKKKQSLGAYYWSAMFQARPKPREGDMLKRAWFKPMKAVPATFLAAVRYWDLAATDKKDAREHDPDFTRSMLMLCIRRQMESDTGETGTGRLSWVMVDGTGGQMGPRKRDDHIVATTQRDAVRFGRGTVVTWLEKDSGGGGEERTAAIVAKLAGHRVRTERPMGMSKPLRTEPFRDQAEAGNVYYVEDGAHNEGYWWNAECFEELAAFPNGAHDDFVDATVGAFAKTNLHDTGSEGIPIVVGIQPSAPLEGLHGSVADMENEFGDMGGIFGPDVGIMG